MKKILLFTLLFITLQLSSQEVAYDEIKAFQEKLDQEYKDQEHSPLKDASRIEKFEGHEFFPIDLKYRVKAKLIRPKQADTIRIPTSSTKVKTFDKYALAKFKIEGKTYELTLYQSHRLREMEEYKNYLFLPFKDYTNGNQTYGGGRYIDLEIPEGDEIIIDFNQSYNPLCAYSEGFSCPIPPEENHLQLKIEAGIKYAEKKISRE